MLPASIIGSIIGKGGTVISQLAELSHAKIKIGGPQDCYPGSSEQVVFIQGDYDAVDMVQELIWHRIADHARLRSVGLPDTEPWNPAATLEKLRTFPSSAVPGVTVTGNILIPTAVCGALIGPNGSAIKALAEETGVHIQLKSKSDPVSARTLERLMTLSGDVENCIQCTANVIAKMKEDSVAYQNKSPSYVYLNSASPSDSQRELIFDCIQVCLATLLIICFFNIFSLLPSPTL